TLDYANGSGLVTALRRLHSIDITARGARSAFYELHYVMRPYTGRSFLNEIRRYGTDASPDQFGKLTNAATILALPPTSFEPEAAGADPWSVRDLSNSQWGLPQEGGPLPPVMNGVAIPADSTHN